MAGRVDVDKVIEWVGVVLILSLVGAILLSIPPIEALRWGIALEIVGITVLGLGLAALYVVSGRRR